MTKRLLSLALALILTAASIPSAAATAALNRSAALPALKEIYQDYFLMGNIFSAIYTPSASNISPTNIRSDLLKRHFNALTGENAMKPQYMSLQRGTYTFSNADQMVQMSLDAGMAIHGHTLIWHLQSSAWQPASRSTRTQARTDMEAFIRNVAGHYKEKVISWDVVNEAFTDGVGSVPSNWRDALRKNSPWYIAYDNGADKSKGESGADYIYDAFVFTRLADPGAILYYNDFNEEQRGKREAIAMMTEELNNRWRTDSRNTQRDRLLIEGLGMQSHYWTDNLRVQDVEDTIVRWIKTGAEISITELDIPAGRWGGFKTLTEAEEKKQAQLYAQLFQIYKKYSGNIARVTIWGLEDPASWRRQGSPLLFDGDFNAKEAFFAVADPDGYLAGRYDNRSTREAELRKATAPPIPAPDLESASDWARAGITAAFNNGYIPTGVQNTYTQTITRAEFCRMAVKWVEFTLNKPLAAILAERGLTTDPNTFEDTSHPDLLAAYALGITMGTTAPTAGVPGRFSPNRPFTREQAAVMIMNTCAAVGMNVSLRPPSDFTDMLLASDWAVDGINFVRANGIMSGISTNPPPRFDPQAPFTREQSIVTFNNIKPVR
jgi:GH35 family endo-1,4-beta-xylanase